MHSLLLSSNFLMVMIPTNSLIPELNSAVVYLSSDELRPSLHGFLYYIYSNKSLQSQAVMHQGAIAQIYIIFGWSSCATMCIPPMHIWYTVTVCLWYIAWTYLTSWLCDKCLQLHDVDASGIREPFSHSDVNIIILHDSSVGWYWFHPIIILQSIHLSVRPSVRESGRSREAIRPVLKKLPILRIAKVGRYTKEPTDITSNGTSPGLKERFAIARDKNSIETQAYVWRPGDGERARFKSRGCSLMLDRERWFYSKSLLLRAPEAEAARQLTSFLG